MTAEKPASPERLTIREDSIPGFVIEDDVPDAQRTALEAFCTRLWNNPETYVVDLQAYVEDPTQSQEADTWDMWRRLTEYGSQDSLIGFFYYDRTTNERIRNDQKRHDLYAGRGGDMDIDARGRAMRARDLELLLMRMIETRAVGNLSLRNAA